MRDQATTIMISIHHVMGEPSHSRIVGAIFVCAPSRRTSSRKVSPWTLAIQIAKAFILVIEGN